MNLFSNPNKAVEDEHNIRVQILSTRIYIILLGLTLVILNFYSSLRYTTNITTIDISSADDYVKLTKKYTSHSSTSKLECPCKIVSIAHSSYIHQLEPSFHDICSSDAISNEWLNILFEIYLNLDYPPSYIHTFEGTAFAHYQALKMMCDLIKEAVDAARTLFMSSTVITSQMIYPDQFEKDTKAAIEQFQRNIPNNFLHVLELVRGFNQANGLISVYSTNWHMFPVSADVNVEPAIISFEPLYYGECNCATTATCHQLLESSVPGYAVGCVPLESLQQSTVECHYNLSCIQSLYSYVTGECL
ncbi:unnamed protein product [Rotaria sp. Silwood1]|nr:unnamed protein product [Rotaria sp. Silwood1]